MCRPTVGGEGQRASLGLGELALWGSATHHAEGTECIDSALRGSSSLLRRTEITSKQLAGLELVGRPPSSRWVSECRKSRVGVWGRQMLLPPRKCPLLAGEKSSQTYWRKSLSIAQNMGCGSPRAVGTHI